MRAHRPPCLLRSSEQHNTFCGMAPLTDIQRFASGSWGWKSEDSGGLTPLPRHGSPQGLLARFGPSAQLAMLLAHERAKGAASAWAPYVATLPGSPGAGWCMLPHELEAALATLGAPRCCILC